MTKDNEIINTSSLIRISKLAQKLGKSAAWVRKIGDEGLVDLVEIDGFYFCRVNQKLNDYLKGR